MSTSRSAMWGDWHQIPLPSCLWGFGRSWNGTTGTLFTAPFLPLDNAHVGLDIIDAGGLGADGPSADVIGGGVSKPSLFAADVATQFAEAFSGFQTQIAIPDFVINKQPGNLVDWTGAFADDMGEGSLRRYLEFEVVLIGNPSLLGGTLPDLAGFHGMVKYRGYGDPDGSVSPPFDTEDAPVASATLFAAQDPAVFPNMSMPPGDGSDPTFVPSFAAGPGASLRLRSNILVPNTCGIGDWAEIMFVLQAGAAYGSLGTIDEPVINFWGAKYRWIVGPLDPGYDSENQTTQFTSTSGADSTDESEPRLDEGPYEP
jgi:hypothetical protein